jgi:hypothetical protein
MHILHEGGGKQIFKKCTTAVGVQAQDFVMNVAMICMIFFKELSFLRS